MKHRKYVPTFEGFISKTQKLTESESVNENYGKELDKLQKAFDAVVDSMRGSSIISNGAIDVWIDFGVRNQFCDENGELTKKIDETFFYDKKVDIKALDDVLKDRGIYDSKVDDYADKIILLFKYHGISELPNFYSSDIFRLDSYERNQIPDELLNDLEKVGIRMK
jgi:hypothetical protein